jgi:hypothetical protein
MILPQLIERQDFHKCFEEYEQAADGRAVDDEEPQSRAAHFRAVAKNLRDIAATDLRYDIRRRDQLLALAAGFERFAEWLELQTAAE